MTDITETAEVPGIGATTHASGAPALGPAPTNTRTLIGRIVSAKRSKTVTVLVERRSRHELYGKIVAKSRKYHAHDENGDFKLGDTVEISETRPISKTKAWKVTRLLERARLV